LKLLDSRRLTGPNLLSDRPGAALEVELSAAEAEAAIAAWRAQARRLLDAVGWQDAELGVRQYATGASLAMSAPIDALYAATEVNEAAWAAAEAELGAVPAPGGPQNAELAPHGRADLREGEEVERLRSLIARERNPALLALRDAAAAHGVSFLAGDEQVSVGLGAGSRSWPAGELPSPGAVDWRAVHDVPVALVTGTNGKTTTVRMLAAMAAAAGRRVGATSTDRITVGGEVLERGDYSGGEGARRLLRDRRVDFAVLETARGGLLRRGLALPAADAAAVTNVAADHLGEFGIEDVDQLAEVKLLVTRIVRPGGRAVLNADDPLLAARGTRGRSPITWFSLGGGGGATSGAAGGGVGPAAAGEAGKRGGGGPAAENTLLASHLAAGGDACLVRGEELVLVRGGWSDAVVALADVPAAFGGAARYNVANALAAIGLAAALGLPPAAMSDGLRSLGRNPADNPGRGQLLEIDGYRVLVDYAHNPHGLAALRELAAELPAARRLVILGQAGDRGEEAIRELARGAWALRPDRIIVKELPEMLRGRQPGEVPAILESELRRLGVPAEALSHAPTELDAVRQALAWARPGDLLVLLVHTQRDEVMALLGG
jgi:cyanophycin synthetase